MSLTIPRETTDLIVDFLQDDLYSLTACTSISHAFRSSSHRYLFSRIRITYEIGCAEFADYLSTHPEVIPYIKHMSIYDYGWFQGSESFVQVLKTLLNGGQFESLYFKYAGPELSYESDNLPLSNTILMKELLSAPAIRSLKFEGLPLHAIPSGLPLIGPNVKNFSLLLSPTKPSPNLPLPKVAPYLTPTPTLDSLVLGVGGDELFDIVKRLKPCVTALRHLSFIYKGRNIRHTFPAPENTAEHRLIKANENTLVFLRLCDSVLLSYLPPNLRLLILTFSSPLVAYKQLTSLRVIGTTNSIIPLSMTYLVVVLPLPELLPAEMRGEYEDEMSDFDVIDRAFARLLVALPATTTTAATQRSLKQIHLMFTVEDGDDDVDMRIQALPKFKRTEGTGQGKLQKTIAPWDKVEAELRAIEERLKQDGR